MEVITSKANEKVKFIKSLNDKKARKINNVFYLEGIKVVEEVINNVKAIDIMFIAYSDEILNNINGGKKFLNLIKVLELENDINILNIKKEIFESITDTKTPQGVLAVIKIKKYDIDDILKEDKILLLDKIQDAGNIGTIIRTADAFNVKGIICMENTADVYSPKVVRSTMGSILREKIIYIKSEDLFGLKKYGHILYGTSLSSNKYIEDINFSKKSIFVLGNEANGISEEVEKVCDSLVKIKMSGNAESLNVAIAAGIILHAQYIK